MGNYITKDCTNYAFDDDYKQHFFSNIARKVNIPTLLQQRQSGYITDLDINVIQFISDVKYVTSDILQIYLGDEFSQEDAVQYLEKLFKSRFITKFMMELIPTEGYPSDALDIYCLDVGGNALLQNFGSPNSETDQWFFAQNYMSAAYISYYLTGAMFYAKVINSCQENLFYFKAAPVYRFGRNTITPAFELCVLYGDKKKYFVGEITRKQDLAINLRTRAGMLETVLATNAWKKYFSHLEKAPTLLVIAEDDDTVLVASDIIQSSTEIQNCRYTTVDRCRNKLSEPGVFLKYDKEKKALLKIKTNVFSPPGKDVNDNC